MVARREKSRKGEKIDTFSQQDNTFIAPAKMMIAASKIEKLMLWKRCKHETFWCVNEAPLLMLWSSINDNFLGCNLVRIRQSMAARCIEKLVSCSQNNKSNYKQ